MPTDAEWTELRTKCTWMWSSNYNGTGVSGRIVTGPNGNSVFFPAKDDHYEGNFKTEQSGGSYWSASLYADFSADALGLYFFSDHIDRLSDARYAGHWIRAVLSLNAVTVDSQIAVLAAQVTNLTNDNDVLKTQVTDLTKDNADLTVKNDDLQKDKDALQTQVTDLTKDNADLTVKNADLQKDTADLKTQVADLTKDNTDLIVKNDDQKKEIESLKTELETLKAQAHGGMANGHEYVDLGLPSGLLWATCNVGAESAEDYGWHLAWGETEQKDIYDWSTYKWCNGTPYKMTKYCNDLYHTSPNDGKRSLDEEDDAASVNWGGDWRTPSYEEWFELQVYCTWTWTDNYKGTGVSGCIVTGPNDSSIFLPAAGYYYTTELSSFASIGYYWSSSLYGYVSSTADRIYFDSGSVVRNEGDRCFGMSVRPVLTVPTEGLGNDISVLTAQVTALQTQVDDLTKDNADLTVKNDDLQKDKDDLRKQIEMLKADFEALKSQTSEVSKCTAKTNGRGFVDLGLPSGLLWASSNVGAESDYNIGDTFAWGDVDKYVSYDFGEYSYYNPWVFYKWSKKDYNTLKKYCSDSRYGTVDGLSQLERSDDVASVDLNWGGSWRTPTSSEWSELITNCTWTWMSDYVGSGLAGYVVTGPNGNSIFLPADERGHGNYWSSTLLTGAPYYASLVHFVSESIKNTQFHRYENCFVRPVCLPIKM